MIAVTRWIPCKDEQPSRIGWYDVKYQYAQDASETRLWWTGKEWRESATGMITSFGNFPGRFPGDAWQGLAVKP